MEFVKLLPLAPCLTLTNHRWGLDRYLKKYDSRLQLQYQWVKLRICINCINTQIDSIAVTIANSADQTDAILSTCVLHVDRALCTGKQMIRNCMFRMETDWEDSSVAVFCAKQPLLPRPYPTSDSLNLERTRWNAIDIISKSCYHWSAEGVGTEIARYWLISTRACMCRHTRLGLFTFSCVRTR